ncbi:hypothetical protein HI145_RS01845 [Escherichia coli]|nr:hypothetical protein [Escherichia coli]
MAELIARNTIEGIEDVTLSYDSDKKVYVVRYGLIGVNVDYIDEAFEKYFEFINMAYNDYR